MLLPPPTQHNTTHTKVSKTTFTQQIITPTKRSQKTNNKLSINLPPKKHHRRSTPFHTKQVQQSLCQRPTKKHTRHTKNATIHTYLPHIDLNPVHPTKTPSHTKHAKLQTKSKHTPPSHLRSKHLTQTLNKPKTSKSPHITTRLQTKNIETQPPPTQSDPTRQPQA